MRALSHDIFISAGQERQLVGRIGGSQGAAEWSADKSAIHRATRHAQSAGNLFVLIVCSQASLIQGIVLAEPFSVT